jgi:aminoglycoside 3-N-acetyltransferase
MRKEGGYDLQELKDALMRVGVLPGTTLVMHSSLIHLGRLEGHPIRDYPRAITAAVRELLGEDGTLVTPAAYWSYGSQQLTFDVKRSPVSKELGVVSQYVSALAESERSPNPIFSVAAIGRNARFICEVKTGSAFGVDSPWDRLFTSGADMLLLGSTVASMTFIRYIEHRWGVPYLYNKLFRTPVTHDGLRLNLDITAPLRYRHAPAQYDLSRFEARLRELGVLRETRLGGGTIARLGMQDCFTAGVNALTEDAHYFLSSVPAYQEGVVPIA